MREIDWVRKATYSLGEILSDQPLQVAPRILIGDTTFHWLAIFNFFLPETAEFSWLAMNWFIPA